MEVKILLYKHIVVVKECSNEHEMGKKAFFSKIFWGQVVERNGG